MRSVSPVVARPKSDFYGFIILLALCGLGVLVAAFFVWHDSPRRAPQDLWIGLTAIFVVFFLPCIFMLWLMRHLRIVADERGLEFRSAFTTRFIEWQSIEDYELRASPNAATSPACWICAHGKWRRLPQLYTQSQALRARIQAEATASRARDWQLNVARDDADNWPKTYAYRDPSGGKMFGFVAAALLLCVAVIGSNLGSSATANSGGDALIRWLYIAALLLPLLLIHYALFRATKRLGGQTIRADQNALTLVDGDAPTRIAWDEITDYFIEDPRGAVTIPQYVIEGAGARLAFHREITGFGELQALVCARAVNASSHEWLHRESTDTDILGGAQSLWPGDVAGVERKIYHYRTRTLRALLFLGGVIILVILANTISSLSRRAPETGSLLMSVFFFLATFILTVGGALAFWRASIQTDENGVTQRGIWGERFLSWSEIESLTFNGHFYAVKGQNTTIRYWLVAAEQSLRAEIETRAELKMNRTDRSQDG